MQTRILALLAAFIIFALTGCAPFPNQPLVTAQSPRPTSIDVLRTDLVVVSVDNVPYGTFPRSSIVVSRNAIIIPSCAPLLGGNLPEGCAKDAATLVNPASPTAPLQPSCTSATDTACAAAHTLPSTATRPKGWNATWRGPDPRYPQPARPLTGPNGERPPCTRPQYTCDIPPPYRADSSL